jgi:hypothetical protein
MITMLCIGHLAFVDRTVITATMSTWMADYY